jgi:tetratricopeptide (TPR) repeat protein
MGSTGSEYRVNLINLANIYNENGDYQKALDALHRIKDYPEDSREVLHNKSYYFNNIAVAYAGLGKHNKSLKYYDKSLRLKERIYEPGNPELALPYSNIAIVYLRLELFHKSYELFKKAYNIRKQAYGIDHPMMGSTLSGLATTANYIGKTDESEKFHHLAITNVAKNYGTDHYRYAFALRNYAKFLIDTDLFEQAEDSLNKAHDIITNNYGENHALNAYITNIKAKLYEDWKKSQLANAYYQKTIDLFKENYGPDYKKLAKTYSNYGIFKYEQNHTDDAIQLFVEANKIFEPNKSFAYGKNLYYLGKSHLSIGHRDTALVYLRDAYKIVSKAKSDTIPLAKKIQHLLSGNF